MAKPRVHEIARELGVTSSDLLAKLKELGEYVKGPSSTVEAPVVRKLREAFPVKPAETATEATGKAKAPAKGGAAKPAKRTTTARSAKTESKDNQPDQVEATVKEDATPSTLESKDVTTDVGEPDSHGPAFQTPDSSASSSSTADSSAIGSSVPGPRPRPKQGGNNPFADRTVAPRPRPRPGGNNPFQTPRAPSRPAASSGDRIGAPPRDSRSAGSRPSRGSGAPRTGAGRGYGPGPGGPPGGRPGPGGRGRYGTAGAFGRAGGKPARGRKSKRTKRQEYEQQQAPVIGGVQVPRGDGTTTIRLRRGATLADFAEKIDVNPASLVTVLFHLGEMATATQSLDEGTLEALGAELGYVIQVVSPEDEDRELLEDFNIDLEAEAAAETDEDLEPRPPVVTVMGHVDHGKTKLLDAIRKSDVISGESGGITQHIGAYQVHHEHEGVQRVITFIDTPGHEAFTAMRARGAEATDIAILVVAADDGVMPQTIEALNHAQAAQVPIVVAVNKIDKEGANPGRVRQQLTEYNLVAEEYGGETMFVDISALKGTGIDDLLGAVLLTADVGLDLRANPDKDARGVAIEAHLDKGRGAVATVLVESGTLKVGDAMVVGTSHGRVRAMFDEHDESVDEAPPARPVQVIGLTSVPDAGDSFLIAEDERTARQIAEKREAADRAAQLASRRKRISLEDFTQALEAGKVDTLSLIIKGDVSGAVEALEDALMAIQVGDGVDLRVIHRGVGSITQNDINLATVDDAIIIGFNVRPAERVQELAERAGVDMRFYTVIYRAIEDIEAALTGMLKPEYEKKQTGSAEVKEIYGSPKSGIIAGSLVREGVIRRGSKARITRDGVVIGEVDIDSLRRFKDDVTEVKDGFECGIGIGRFSDLEVGDTLETFEMVEVSRTR